MKKTTLQLKKSTIKKIVTILKRNKVKKASIFGSYARGDATKKSDIDLLVQPPKGIGFGFAGIRIELEEKIGKKVDLVTYNSVHPYLKKYILAHQVRLI